MSDTLTAHATTGPLFTLDLGANGGIWAPRTLEEVRDWVHTEVQFWRWVQDASVGIHRSAVDAAVQPLREALGQADEALKQAAEKNEAGLRKRLNNVQRTVESAFTQLKLPHSSTPLAKEVAGMETTSRSAAVAYLYVMLPGQQGHRFDPQDLDAWSGFMRGLHARYGLPSGDKQIEAQREAFDQLRENAEQLIGNKRLDLEALQRNYEQATHDISQTKEAHAKDVEKFLGDSSAAHREALEKHTSEMQAIQRAFREECYVRRSSGAVSA